MKQNIIYQYTTFFSESCPCTYQLQYALKSNLNPSCDAMCARQGLAELDLEVEVERGESRFTVLSRKIAVDILPLESY